MIAPNDDHRYLARFDVKDAHGRDVVVRVGAEDGRLMVDGPPHWKAPADLLFEAALTRAIADACQCAAKQRGSQ